MLPQQNHLFGAIQAKPSQSSVPAGLTLASVLGFCFQCQVGSSLVLRRPIETTALTGQILLRGFAAAIRTFWPRDQKVGF